MTRLRGEPRPDLRELRKLAGWTQRDAADQVHRREHMWSKYETGMLAIPPEIEELFRFKVAVALEDKVGLIVDSVLAGDELDAFSFNRDVREPAPAPLRPKKRANG